MWKYRFWVLVRDIPAKVISFSPIHDNRYLVSKVNQNNTTLYSLLNDHTGFLSAALKA